MLTLSAKIRKIQGKKIKTLREKGVLPVVLYGPKIKNESLEVALKDFEKILSEAGESTLISLEVEGKKPASPADGEKNLVLIHEVKFDPIYFNRGNPGKNTFNYRRRSAGGQEPGRHSGEKHF